MLNLFDHGWLSGQAIDTTVAWMLTQKCAQRSACDKKAAMYIEVEVSPATVVYCNTALNADIINDQKIDLLLTSRRWRVTTVVVRAARTALHPSLHARVLCSRLMLTSLIHAPRRTQAAVTKAEFLLCVGNLNANHWVPMQIDKRRGVVTLFDPIPTGPMPTSHAKMAKRYLRFFSKLTSVDMTSFQIQVVSGGAMRAFPAQPDSSSCGVIALVVVYHILMGATFSLDIRDLGKWRKYFALRMEELLRGEHVDAPTSTVVLE